MPERRDASTHFAVAAMPYFHILAVALLALLPRAILLDHFPDSDEMYHVMAARSLLEDGTLTISAGEPYTRAWLFTYATAGMFALFGESLVVARILPLFAGIALVVTMFLWVSDVAGRTAGWCCAVLMSLDPLAIVHSQLIRFYSLQPLMFWLGTIAVYYAVAAEQTARRRTLLLGAAAAAYLVALHLQDLTMVGLVPVGGWVILAVSPLAWSTIAGHRFRWWIVGGVALAAIAAAGAVLTSAAFADLVARIDSVPLWAANREDLVRYYYWLLQDTQPVVLALLPLMAVIAVAWRPRAASLCLAVFVFAFVFHSLAAWKAERYFSGAMPAFFAVAAVAIGALWPPAHAHARAAVASLGGSWLHGRAVSGIAGVLLVLGAAASLVASTGFARLRYAVGVADAQPFVQNGDWQLAAELLRPQLDSAEVVLATVKTTGLYYLGRVDVLLRAPEYPERQPANGWDRQIGRPYVSTTPALLSIVEQHESGVVVADRERWRNEHAVNSEIANYIEANMEPIQLPDSTHMIAYRWSR